MRSAYSGSMPIPLSEQRKRQQFPSASALRVIDRRGLVAELDRVGDQVLEDEPQEPGVAVDGRQRPFDRDGGLALLDRPRQVRAHALDEQPAVDVDVRLLHAPDARERQQVVDQVLHAGRAVDGEPDVLVGARVELPAVALLQQLAEARDLAQRLLEVVRGDVGELLELGVGAAQVGLGHAQRLELGDDPRAHRVDVLAEVDDLARPRSAHLLGEVTARDVRGPHPPAADAARRAGGAA